MFDLDTARRELNCIDENMKKLFIRRMEIVKDIAIYKKANNLPTFDANREKEMKERLSCSLDDIKDYYLNFLEAILVESKKYQNDIKTK